MGVYRLKLPDLGEGVVESEIVAWRVAPGDKVSEDQPIVDVMTDKATVEVGSPVSGVVISLACAAGTTLGVGQELIRFEVEGQGNVVADEKSSPPQSAEHSPAALSLVQSTPSVTNTATHHVENEAVAEAANNQAPATPAFSAQTNSASTHSASTNSASTNSFSTNSNDATIVPQFPHRTVLTSPSVRRLAREHGIDLSMVPGSGPEGRIEQRDIETYIAIGAPAAGASPLRKRSGGNTAKISGLRRVIAKKIAAAKREIPHYSYIEEVDVTDLEALRAQLNAERQPHQPKLTLLPFLMRALAKALPEFPHCNATYDSATETLTTYAPVHIGIATMTAQGLAVPVVRHCEALDLWQCANEIARLSKAAREQNATREELTGSTITLTSLGTLGGIASTPIINAPETAIIGVNKLQQRPVVVDGAVTVRTMMNLSASFDHRIVDGYDGARLVQALKKLLETPALIFI